MSFSPTGGCCRPSHSYAGDMQQQNRPGVIGVPFTNLIWVLARSVAAIFNPHVVSGVSCRLLEAEFLPCNHGVTTGLRASCHGSSLRPSSVSRLHRSSLQYSPDQFSIANSLVPQEGFEPPTPSLRMMWLRQLANGSHAPVHGPKPGELWVTRNACWARNAEPSLRLGAKLNCAEK